MSVTHLFNTGWVIRHLRGSSAHTESLARVGSSLSFSGCPRTTPRFRIQGRCCETVTLSNPVAHGVRQCNCLTTRKHGVILGQSLILSFLLRSPLLASDWLDSFYPYRVPITINVPTPGRYQVELTPESVTEWINEQADFKLNPRFFSFDNVKLVEVDAKGSVLNPRVDAGYRILIGKELVVNGDFEQQENGKPVGWSVQHEAFKLEGSSHDGSWCMTTTGADRFGCVQNVPSNPHAWYRFFCWAKGADAVTPQITRKGGWWQPIEHTWCDPYLPSQGWFQREYYFNTGDKSNWASEQLQVRFERYTGAVDDVSVRECQVAFVLKADKPGVRRYWLYYSPLEGVTPQVPSQHVAAMPEKKLTTQRAGRVERLDEGMVYSLPSTGLADVWYAATTRKVLEETPPPALRRGRIELSCARNESEALQLVFRPKASGEIRSVTVNLTGPKGATLKPEQFDIRRALYVPIKTPSRSTPDYAEPAGSSFTGRLPDPLPKFSPVVFKAGDPNILIWVDVTVPKSAPAGLYNGGIRLGTSAGEMTIPLTLKVWGFTLPDRPTCRTAFQMVRYANQYLFAFHKVTEQQDKYDLTRAYIAEMARYKISETGATSAISWHAGTRPASPCHDYEIELPWALDQLGMTGYTIGHFSGPSLVNETLESARKTAKEYEPIAACLAEKGWLKDAYIQIDEPQPPAFPGVRNWIDAFREQPHAKDIKMFGFIYNAEAWDALRNHIDILVPENNDSGNAFSLVGMAKKPPKQEVWCYWTNTCHQWIDAPGIDQRLFAPKVWWMGATGMSTWGILLWWKEQSDWNFADNPWTNPQTPWGNGVLAYFYPPNPKGADLPDKDMTVVPSLRMLLTRDGIEDFEYATILDRLIKARKAKGKVTAEAELALAGMRRQFATPVSWTLSELHWQETRAAVASAIEHLTRS